MIDSLKLRNLQSVESADLELGKLTVIVGPSNTGKSATVRGLQLLALNAQKMTHLVREGARSTVIAVTADDVPIGIHRGEGTSEYQVGTEKYTKCGSTAPVAVEAALGLTRLNFAGQFDSPYLLDSTSTEVAKTIGALTGMDALLAAAKEANRRRLAVDAENRGLETQLAQTLELTQNLEAQRELRDTLSDKLTTIAKIRAAVTKRDAIINALTSVAIAVKALDDHTVPAIPYEGVDTDHLELQIKRAHIIGQSIRVVNETEALVADWDQRVLDAHTALSQVPSEESILQEAGTCPTCGQTTTHLTSPPASTQP